MIRRYNVLFRSGARRAWRSIQETASRQDIGRLQQTIDGLSQEPRPRGYRKLDGGFRIRVGRWRVIYEIDDDQRVVVIFRIARRSERTYDL